MTASRYAKGAAFERQVLAELTERGDNEYTAVRSAGSHSLADIVAINRKGIAFLIQCKTNGRLDLREWNAFYGEAISHRCIPILAYKVDGKAHYSRLTGLKEPWGHNPPKEVWRP